MFNYAKLSMDAKKAGGPDKLMNDVYQSGKWAGRIETLSLLALGALVVGAGVFAVTKLTQKQDVFIDETSDEIEPDEDLYEFSDDESDEEDPDEDFDI